MKDIPTKGRHQSPLMTSSRRGGGYILTPLPSPKVLSHGKHRPLKMADLSIRSHATPLWQPTGATLKIPAVVESTVEFAG